MNATAAIVKAVASPFAPKKPRLTKRVREVAEFVAQHPGCSRAAVIAHFGSAGRTIGVHLQAAQANGLVRCEYAGRYSKWYPNAAPDTN
jgi:hypothetical protein